MFITQIEYQSPPTRGKYIMAVCRARHQFPKVPARQLHRRLIRNNPEFEIFEFNEDDWSNTRATKVHSASPRTFDNWPCAYRGPSIDTRDCRACGGVKKEPIAPCELHGLCAMRTVKRIGDETIEVCLTCEDRA